VSVETAKQYRQLALKYRAFGFNLVPLGGDKLPVLTGKVLPDGKLGRFFWKDWQTTPQTDAIWAQIKKHEWWVNVGGLGGICGPASNYLICFDFDDTQLNTVIAFLDRIGLPSDYAWTVKTPGNGVHVWVRSPGFDIEKSVLKRAPIDGIGIVELRWLGSIGVLPGSLHPDVSGVLYDWMYSEPNEGPAEVDRNLLLTAYMETTKDIKAPLPVHTNGNAPHVPGQGYAAKAFDEELQRVRTSAPHTHNDTLNRAAHSLGQLVGAGLLTEGEVESALLDAALEVGQGEGEAIATIRSGLRSGIAKPRAVTLNGNGFNSNDAEPYAYGFAVDLPDALDLDELPASKPAKHHTWPYTIKDGRMCLLKEDKDGDIVTVPIASFTARITGQIEDEDGSTTFVISGEAIRGGPYRLEQPAERFGKEGELRAALEKAVGPYDPVYNRMGEHLVPAIKIMTTEDNLETIRRYKRTGWRNGEFLMPGMQADDVRIELPDKLAYHVSADADLGIAKAALTNLIGCVDPAISAPILAMLLQAPIHRPAGWQNERYGVFIQGRTGSLKTSFTQTAMSIYGPEFSHDHTLIKLGEGSTRNAIMAFATNAHDMPLFIDNYKPNTGFGFHDLVNLIHNILEGGEKDRLSRASTIKESRPVHCFPIITGEDVPDHDPATLARLLLIAFEWQAGQPNEKLALAQKDSEQLSAIGLSWLTWVGSPEGQRIIKDTARFLPAVRDGWALYLREIRKDMVNILRVATNIATNELTWSIALQHPVLGELLAPYTTAHGDGLRRIAVNMAKATTEALEAVRFLAGLRELLATGQGVLIDRSRKEEDVPLHERDRMVGWIDDEGIYLLPTVAMERIRKMLGQQAITVSLQVLYGQFDGLKMIAARGRDKVTRPIRQWDKLNRVLHLNPDVLESKNEAEEADGKDDDLDAATQMGL